MTDLPGEKSRRTGTFRSRGGCATCKFRHVKCDETRPACVKCVATGRKCDGYAAPQRPEKAAPLALPDSGPYAIPFRVPGSQSDRRVLHYFCIRAADDLSGYVASDFWSRVVLQRSQEVPAVRRAVVALGSLHFDYANLVTPNGGRGRDVVYGARPESIMEYNKAMRSLRRYLKNERRPSVQVALICCALFYAFESARGSSAAAMRHLHSGVMMLKEARGQAVDNGPQDYEMEELSRLFSRLDLQATFFYDGRLPLLAPASPDEPTNHHRPSGEAPGFASLEEARFAQTQLHSRLFRFLIANSGSRFLPEEQMAPDVVEQKRALECQYRHWEWRFDKLSAQLRKSATPAQVITGLSVLRIQHLTPYLLLQSGMPYDPTVFNPPADSPPSHPHRVAMRTILDLSQSVLGTSPDSPPRVLSTETGIVAPLFLLAMKSGDPAVVERAVALLAACGGRREGMYDARTTAGVTEQLVALRTVVSGPGGPRSIPALPLEFLVGGVTDGGGGVVAQVPGSEDRGGDELGCDVIYEVVKAISLGAERPLAADMYS